MKLKNNLIVLLPVMAAAVAAVMAVSCEKDANWKPTWALPLVKEQTILIEKFIDDKTVKEVNDKVRDLWDNYVEEHLGRNISLDSANFIDSIAYLVLVNNKDSTYVTFEDGTPKLNDSIIAKIEKIIDENPDIQPEEVDAKIDQINNFLKIYWNALQRQKESIPSTEPMAKSRAIPKNTDNATSSKYRGDSAIYNLLDAMIHPTDVFITAANVLSAIGSDNSENYIDPINAQIDSVLSKANMDHSIDIDFTDYVGKESPIEFIKLDVDTKSAEKSDNLPFEFNFKADFIDYQGKVIENILDKVIRLNEDQSLSFESENTERIVSDTKSVKFTVKIKRTESMSEKVLRTLSKKGISFSVRVQVKTAMSKLDVLSN